LSREASRRPAARRPAAHLRITGGAWRGRAFSAPIGDACRPTQARAREALFDRLGARVEGVRVVDLFAGSGALGLEALSRGAVRAVFVERDPAALAVLRRNLDLLGAGQRGAVRACDAEAFLEGEVGPAVDADLVLADPPYGTWSAAWGARLARGGGLRRAERTLLVIETTTREAEPTLVPGWRRWPARCYGDTRITIDEREGTDDAGAGT
jgi:16S rRNA (guanine(966)-N(2))-methyltransferase RsmD